MPCIIVPRLQGGLGNWLFQVAATVKFAQASGVEYKLSKTHCHLSPHSSVDYFLTILSKFASPVSTEGEKTTYVIREPDGLQELTNVEEMIGYWKHKVGCIIVDGYYQKHNYIPRVFRQMLTLPEVDDSKVRDTCFLHIRGGDYVNHPLHDVKLDPYYGRCIALMKEKGITKFSVFTNDKEYATSRDFLKDIDYAFVDAPEIETLVLMSKCKAGICANSSFSWWGAYLTPDRPICMPAKWFNNPTYDILGYYFPGVFIIDVDDMQSPNVKNDIETAVGENNTVSVRDSEREP
jgi:hypothetical protein